MGPSDVKSKKRAGKLIIFLFILAFIVSVISDYSTARHLKNVCTAVTSGTVTHIHDSMDLFSKITSIDYEYFIGGKTYKKHCFGKHNFMIAKKGDVFEVHYDPYSSPYILPFFNIAILLHHAYVNKKAHQRANKNIGYT